METTERYFEPTPYERYEDELVALLQMEGVEVRPLPRVADLEAPRPTQIPQVFVLINGGQFADREELAVVAQLETVQGELFIRARNRRGPDGLFAVYEEIRRRLLGYRLRGAKTPVYFNSFGYVDGLHNSWQYALTFSFAAYCVAADRDGERPPEPPIKRITHEIQTV